MMAALGIGAQLIGNKMQNDAKERAVEKSTQDIQEEMARERALTGQYRENFKKGLNLFAPAFQQQLAQRGQQLSQEYAKAATPLPQAISTLAPPAFGRTQTLQNAREQETLGRMHDLAGAFGNLRSFDSLYADKKNQLDNIGAALEDYRNDIQKSAQVLPLEVQADAAHSSSPAGDALSAIGNLLFKGGISK